MTRFGLSLMPEPGFATAAEPLFSEGIVSAVEWSFDIGWGSDPTPAWLDELLDFYCERGWLLGHGVSYSLLGAAGHHEVWLDRLREEVERRRYRWITEHIGFVGAGRFTFSAPLPIPVGDDVIQLGTARLGSLAAAAGVPVGVENLATCLSIRDAHDQGRLVSELLTAVDGIALLDLHNLWCQSVNTGVAVQDLLDAFPLDRVREIHVAGGRPDVGAHSGRTLRRDTHDALVPDEVVDLLTSIAPRCPNLEVVIYERLGTSLDSTEAQDLYRQDVCRLAAVVAALPATAPSPLTTPQTVDLSPIEIPAQLQRTQAELLEGFYAGVDAPTLQQRLNRDDYPLDPDLTAVATELTRTWGRLRA